jgi:hypothetical protein
MQIATGEMQGSTKVMHKVTEWMQGIRKGMRGAIKAH